MPRKSMPRKQEQEDARPDVTEVAPNVLRMELPVAIPGLRHVNCYALIDAEGAALVDPGLPGPSTRRALQDRLAQAGLRETDVHTVVITHSHPDHFGCANWLARSAGARVLAYGAFGWGIGVAPSEPHAASHHEVSVDDLQAQADRLRAERRSGGEADKSLSQRWRERRGSPSPWGGSPLGPPETDGEMSKVAREMMEEDFFPAISHPVVEGDAVRLAGREWFVRYTPGHTADHICLHSPELGLFLSGDHVLPTITPHIAGTGPVPDPLDVFMKSLDEVCEIDGVERVLPAHGHPFDDLAGRAREIQRHHHERLDQVRKIGNELGAASVVDFSKRLFAERSWGVMAESETYAHLEHLRHAREAERYAEDGVLFYVTG
ncbi:MAG: MBL fold metallo-hydrolase [Myxococcota bacterium]|nr:MBL fold metallo-hydrolase [Myxococcota bacterium]